MRTPGKFLIIFLAASLICLRCLATVSITQGSGGTNISADKSSGSLATPAYTNLGTITITSGATTDFSLTGGTITLTAPANWQFQSGATVTATGLGNITVVSATVSSTNLVVTYTNGGANLSNGLTIAGLPVQATIRKPIASVNITASAAPAILGLSSAAVAPVSQVVGAFAKLQLLLPGETAAAGTTTGKTGTPNTVLAGTAITLTVNAVDANWNIVNTITDNVAISDNATADPTAVVPAALALTSGTKTFSFTARTPGTTNTITATDATDGTKTANISPAITVTVGTYSSLLIILPGETYTPSTATGKSGTASTPTAGTPFSFTVYAVDAAFNTVTSVTESVAITSNDANAVLPSSSLLISGTQTFSITLKTYTPTHTITATGSKSGVSSAITTLAAAFAKLQVILTGETAAPGTVTGKTGSPTAITAGASTNVTVNAVDAYWNKVTTVTDVVNITSTDAGAIMPANTALVAGTKSFTIALRTPSTTTTFTATDVTDGTKTANTSSAITVSAGAYNSLLVIMPGETYAPSTATGKTGTATSPVAGTPFNVTVYAVDAGFNNITSVNESVAITSNDANAILPASAALSSGTQTFSVTLLTATTSRTVTATGSKTGTSSAVTTVAGAFVKLQVLLTGEVTAPGTVTGKTGTPTAINAGSSTTATVNAVDAYWNKVTTVTDVASVTSTDAGATITASGAMASGTKGFTVTLRTPGTTTVTATDATDGTKTNSTSTVTVNLGAFTNLLTVLPGETYAPGTSTGKTGTPTAPVAGTAFNFNVYAVDAGNNTVTSVNDNITTTATDVNAVLPASANLSSGVQTFSFTFKTAGSWKITATDATVSKSITTASLAVIPGAFVKLLLIMPGETAAPGTVTGKTGAPTARASGTAFSVIVNAVDANWNRVSAVTSVNPTLITDVINIISNDAAVATPVSTGTMAAGTKTISVNLKTPTTTATLQAVDQTNAGMTSYTSPNFTVTIGTFTKLQLLMPGETAAPNTTTGKTGTPIAQVAGTPFTVTVNAVDANWNIVSTATDVVHITSTDVNASSPTDAALVAGTQTFTYTFKTAGTRKLTASDVTNTTRTASNSPNITVTAGAFSQLLAIAAGETAAPGTATGKTGTPTVQAAGKAFTVTVYAVDANWNKVTTVTDMVTLTTTDGAATMPAPAALVAGAKSFSVTLKTIGTQTVTAADGGLTYTTSNITVTAGVFAKLLILMPGETSAPGTTTGKTGTATTPLTAGTPFNVTVYAVDAAWDILTTPTDVISISSTTDINAALPANTALVGGTKTLSVTFKTAGTNRNVVAKDVTDGTKTSSTGASVTVVAGAFAQLQILLPGETAKPGTIDGKSGAANPPARGTAFNIVVNAVDANWNVINTITNTVTMTSSDGSATLPAPTALVAGTKTLSVKIVSTSTSPLPTLTATTTSPAISNTVSVPVSVPPTLATDFFRTLNSGDWTDASIWESSTNGTTGWQNATLVPGASAGGVTILNGYTVNVPAGTSTASKLALNNGGTLTVVGTLSIGSGGADVHGTIVNAGTITPTGTLMFESDGKYQHNFTSSAGTIPTATWDPNSTCEIIGYTSYSGTIGGGGQAFGNFIWNCANQNITGGVALGAVTATMNNLTITTTGAGSSNFQLVTGTGATANVTVKSFTQTGGNFLLSNTSTATANLNVTGDFNVSGGTMKTTGLNLISFSGTTTQNFIKTGGTFSTAVNFAVNSGATVDFSTNVLDGSSGTFTLNNGGTLITANDDGIAGTGALGSIQTTGTRSFGTAANFIYDDVNAQNAGTGLPTTINNITINNAQSVTLPAATNTYTINGALTLTAGNLDMNTNTLVAGGGFTATGAGFIRTQSLATAPIPSGKSWAVGVEYYAASNQNVVSGTYNNLSFSQAGVKTVTGDITVNGNWSSADGNIDFLSKSAAATFSGVNQTLNDNTDSVEFKNVTFGNSGTKTLNSGGYQIAPLGFLTMSGTAVLATNGILTVLSDTTGTGNVGPLTAGAITGSVSVQCFITGGGNLVNRGYRLLSSAISNPAAANSFFDLSFLHNGYSYLTGANGGGFDAIGNPTLYLFSEALVPSNASFTSGNFRAITAINNSYNIGTIDGAFNLPVGTGVLYFFRGNNTTVSTNPPNNVTLSSTGPLNQGQIKVSTWFTGSNNLSYTSTIANTDVRGFNLVGNPYACSIDWNTAFSSSSTTGIYSPNVDQTIYVYVPQSKNYAAYMYQTTGTNGASNIIAPGQGFFVRATNTSAQLYFNETAKINSRPATSVLNAAPQMLALSQMHLVLSKDSINKDETAIVFNNAASSNYVRGEDALYFRGSGVVSLSNKSADNQQLAISKMPFPKQTQAIPLNVQVSSAGNYQFTLNQIANIPALYDIWLVDNYLSDSLDMRANKTYSFSINGNAASSDSSRFKLVIRPNPVLAVHLLSFSAIKATSTVNINWTVENEANYTQYILQRSTDGGKTYKVLDSLTSANLGTYNDLDPNPITGRDMYRLEQIDVLGNITYSNVITVMYAPPGNVNSIVSSRISLYPNPTANTLNVAIKTDDSSTPLTGNYKITVTNSVGIIVKSGISTQASWQSDVSALTPGTYFIQIINTKNNSLTGQSSFIKL